MNEQSTGGQMVLEKEVLSDVVERLADLLTILRDGPVDGNGSTGPVSLVRTTDAADPVAVDDDRPVEKLPGTEVAFITEGPEASGEIGVLSKKYNHRGTEWWNPLSQRQGTDTFSFSLPAGHVFSHYELRPITTSIPHELRVVKYPPRGAQGTQEIAVRWALWGGGQVAYEILAAHHEKGTKPRLRVVVGRKNWDQQAIQLISQKKPFVLSLTGEDARRLWNDFLAPLRQESVFEDDTEVDPVVTPTVLITGAIIAGIVAIAGFATIAYVLNLAIEKGCKAKAKFGQGGDEGTYIDFDVCGSG